MAPLNDLEILAKFRHALQLWRFTGYITWKATAHEWVEWNLEGWATRALGEEMSCHFDTGGEIDQVRETRPEWSERSYRYEFRIQIGDRLIYIETILVEDDPNDPTVHVVSIHDA